MNVLFVVNDAPYGSEKVFNTLRIAQTILREHPTRASASSCLLTRSQAPSPGRSRRRATTTSNTCCSR